MSVTFFTSFNVFNFPNVFYNVGSLNLRAASRLTRSTFKITATKFNGFINNRILYPVIRMKETMNSTILKISLLA